MISGLAYKASKGKADELTTRNNIEDERLDINQKAIESQMAEQQAKVDQMRALAELKQKQLDALKVRAGIDGVLVDLAVAGGATRFAGGDAGQGRSAQSSDGGVEDCRDPGPRHADRSNRQWSIPTTASFPGTVMRVDPAVQNGTVTVDVKLTGDLPKGARPDLSVDGTIDLERLENVLYVGRPAFGQENSTISLFKLDADGKGAVRVPVKVGRASVNSIQIIEGLHEGDTVILSDMSRWDNTDRIRLD